MQLLKILFSIILFIWEEALYPTIIFITSPIWIPVFIIGALSRIAIDEWKRGKAGKCNY